MHARPPWRRNKRRMGELRVSLLARELDVDLQANNLASRRKELEDRERELANKEKQLAKKQLQELAATRKSLEELQAVWVVEALQVWDFLAKMRLPWCPSASVHSAPGSRYRR
jgi:hypothetical protein